MKTREQLEADYNSMCEAYGRQASQLGRMAEQRDELLEALEACVAVMAKNIYAKPDVPPDHPYAILRSAREVITKAKGAT